MSQQPATLESFSARLRADPTWFPHKLEFASERTLLVKFAADDYARASFLDDRIITAQTKGSWVSFDQITAALAGAQPAKPLHFIFHAGHVGSTLLSRLLGEAEGVLAIREPLPLRALAEAHDRLHEVDSLLSPARFRALLGEQMLLWSRGFADTRAVVLKATSSAARLAPELLDQRQTARAVHLSLKLEPYLATLLAGENSPVDLRGFAGERVRRLGRMAVQLKQPAYAMSLGELAAMAWVAEMLTQKRLTKSAGARVLELDFDLLLGDIEGALRDVCAHFNLTAPEAFFSRASASPVLTRYAKAPEHPYSPRDRAEVLAEARTTMAEEIRTGLAWAENTARQSSEVAAILSG